MSFTTFLTIFLQYPLQELVYQNKYCFHSTSALSSSSYTGKTCHMVFTSSCPEIDFRIHKNCKDHGLSHTVGKILLKYTYSVIFNPKRDRGESSAFFYLNEGRVHCGIPLWGLKVLGDTAPLLSLYPKTSELFQPSHWLR